MLSAFKKANVQLPPLYKRFSTSALLYSALKSVPDKSRPDVYHHSADNKHAGNKKYPVSFIPHQELPDGRSIEDYSRAVIGWSTSEGQLNPSTFAENDEFVEFLHKVIGENIHSIDDPSLKGMAEWQQEGWLHIADERNPPPWGRIPLPEDIFGSVLLNKGVIQPQTYQRMPSHRFVTSNGLFKLSDPLQSILYHTLLEDIKLSKQ